MNPTIMLFKNDLRIIDNPALYYASKFAHDTKESHGVVGVFVYCVKEWKVHLYSDCKINLLMKAVFSLKEKLEKEYKIPMYILREEDPLQVPQCISTFCAEVGANALFYNIQYELDESTRDALMQDLLKKQLGINCYSFHDQCAVPPGTCKTKQGGQFMVFTPFKNCWLKILEESDKKLLNINPLPLSNNTLLHLTSSISILESYNEIDKRVKEGQFVWNEDEVHQIANEFITQKANDYKIARDFPAKPGTSCLSPYIALGIITVRSLLNKARDRNQGSLSKGNEGIVTWVSELCWRDFYRNIVVSFPHVMKNKPFKKEGEKIKWSNDEEKWKRWCEGKTGYPIVDAGMRQLNETGFMHNRVRMIVAMFLTKDLLIDWRWGEEYFASNLIDSDFASNNGGWQWSSSTGTDSQPYFRVFNPLLQSQKYDPDGTYIKRWVSELAMLQNPNNIHDPYGTLSPAQFNALEYPKPIVDHSKARLKAIEEFRKVFGKESSIGSTGP